MTSFLGKRKQRFFCYLPWVDLAFCGSNFVPFVFLNSRCQNEFGISWNHLTFGAKFSSLNRSFWLRPLRVLRACFFVSGFVIVYVAKSRIKYFSLIFFFLPCNTFSLFKFFLCSSKCDFFFLLVAPNFYRPPRDLNTVLATWCSVFVKTFKLLTTTLYLLSFFSKYCYSEFQF